MRQYVEELSRIATCHVSAHPNAGLPNEFGEYDESPEAMAFHLKEWAQSGFLNIIGGCCGTSPAHIKAIADAVANVTPRIPAKNKHYCRLSGLEPFTITPESLYVNVGERTNVTGSARFAKLIKEGDYDTALDVARQQVESGAPIIDINMDEGMLDSKEAMVIFLNLIASEPDISRVPIMIDSSKWEVIEAGLKCIQGKGIVNSISMKEGEEKFIEQAKLVRRYGAAVIVKAGVLLLVTPVENRTSPLLSTHNTGAQAIVVLGGGRLANAPEYGGRDIPSLTTLARLRYAAKLHRETALPILVTGGAPDGSTESEAASMARTLREDFSVPVRWIEGDSNNTAENAALTAKILKREGLLRVLLVTDGLHMPRSTAVFEKSGLEIIPAPTILFSRAPLTFFDFLPGGEGLRRSHYAMHEWIGMVWYRLK